MAVGDGFHPVQCFDVSSQDEAETEEFVRQMYVGNRSRLGAGRGCARFSAAVAEADGIGAGLLLGEDSLTAHSLVAEELARTAAVTVLHIFPNSALTVSYHAGPGWVAPAAVRRAAGFIHAHAGQPVTLGEIAAAAGVTGRALEDAFRRYFDTTPIGYLHRVRLERADQEMREADAASGLTVAAVAHRWGWASPRQFATVYRQRFGVLPSQTVGSKGQRR